MKKIISVIALASALLIVSGCGQKGPLIVDQPPLEEPQLQEEEQAPAI